MSVSYEEGKTMVAVINQPECFRACKVMRRAYVF